MYQNTEDFIDHDFEQHVRQAAYHLWENDGRPVGKEKEYWFQAMGKLLAEREHTNDPEQGRANPIVKTR